MKHEQAVQHLNDYVDGRLSPALCPDVEAHIAACDVCRAEVDGLRALLADVAALPRSIEPPRDLWMAIDGALDARAARQRTLWSARYWLAAAALLLAVASSTIALVIASRRTAADRPAAISMPTDLRRTELPYINAVLELEQSLDAAKARLAPETVARIERNVRIIDAAIAEIRGAIADDPSSHELRRMLSNRYRDKLGLLQQAGRLAIGS